MRRPTTAREVTLEFPLALRAGPKETEAENARRASIRMAKSDMAETDFKKNTSFNSSGLRPIPLLGSYRLDCEAVYLAKSSHGYRQRGIARPP